jgi:hypothetical protein
LEAFWISIGYNTFESHLTIELKVTVLLSDESFYTSHVFF